MSSADRQFLDQLNSRLRSASAESGDDVSTVRSRFFRHRFFARLSAEYPGKWVLAGATALEVRANITRATQDLDTITSMAATDLQDAVTALGDNPDDPFDYVLSLKGSLRAANGAQGKVVMTCNGSRVASFKLDIEFSLDCGTPPQTVALPPAYSTGTAADVEASALLQSTADHMAAKVAGVSRLVPLTGRNGTVEHVNQHRYHDLADLALMGGRETVDMADLVRSFEYQTRKWGDGAVPDALILPGADWTPENWERARSRRQWPAALTMDVALAEADLVVDPALRSFHDHTDPSGTWHPGSGWGGDVHVRAYTRADGTEVPEHYRQSPGRGSR